MGLSAGGCLRGLFRTFGRAARARTASCAYALARLVRPRADSRGRTKSFERIRRRPWRVNSPARRRTAQLAVMTTRNNYGKNQLLN